MATCAPADVQVFSHGSDALDITDETTVDAVIRSVRPALLFNAAAYTAVDKAETEKAAALAVNGTAVGVLAEAARLVVAWFVHVSTDSSMVRRAACIGLAPCPICLAPTAEPSGPASSLPAPTH